VFGPLSKALKCSGGAVFPAAANTVLVEGIHWLVCKYYNACVGTSFLFVVILSCFAQNNLQVCSFQQAP
jgi:hypothetical protein